jgi:hypothetical protein
MRKEIKHAPSYKRAKAFGLLLPLFYSSATVPALDFKGLVQTVAAVSGR